MEVTQLKLRLDNSDGTYSEITTIMPTEIADQINCTVIDWKNIWMATTNTVEKFQEAEKKFNPKN